MALCPRCNQRLARTAIPQGVAFDCPKCKGRAIGIPVLRKLVPEKLVKDLWLRARQEDAWPGKECPICHRAMAEVPVPASVGSVALDVCPACQFVWLDPMESGQLPSVKREPSLRERLPEKAREQIALMQLKTLEAKERASCLGEESPDEEWKWIPALFGFPVEFDVNPIRCWPWLTWGLAAAMALVFALTAWNLKPVVDDWGLVPAQLGRHGGLTLLTSFFLHGGFLHLLGNAYFLLVFGDNVEDDLGRWRYALLIAGAALFGDLLHILADPWATVPCVGASGGISGAIAFYALRYPHARLGFLWRILVLVPLDLPARLGRDGALAVAAMLVSRRAAFGNRPCFRPGASGRMRRWFWRVAGLESRETSGGLNRRTALDGLPYALC